ncbi:hypothetical protein BJY04DRAFT_202671 [Aspergillus karnatakaensis]|uniref:uncharacterized protein n=1 Tax=Aspergillus karnatakaensis TaxID=1810916 RepID=UPI003CCC9577
MDSRSSTPECLTPSSDEFSKFSNFSEWDDMEQDGVSLPSSPEETDSELDNDQQSLASTGTQDADPNSQHEERFLDAEEPTPVPSSSQDSEPFRLEEVLKLLFEQTLQWLVILSVVYSITVMLALPEKQRVRERQVRQLEMMVEALLEELRALYGY